MSDTPKQPEGPPFAASSIPADPDEQEAWSEKFTEDLLDHYRGGIGVPWNQR